MKKHALAFLAMTLAPACLYAVDGVTLINQSTVNAAGGFPYRIMQSGSYKLSGPLSPLVNQSAIVISANNVVLDLNGFSVQCSLDGTAPFINIFGCISDNLTAAHNITIRNGTVTLTGSASSPNLVTGNVGVSFLASNRVTVEYLQIEVNLTNLVGRCLDVPTNSIVRSNILSGNQGGVDASCPALLDGNINAASAGGGHTGGNCVFVNNIGSF